MSLQLVMSVSGDSYVSPAHDVTQLIGHFQFKPRILRAGDFPSLRERLKQVRSRVEANVLISTHGEYLLLRLETEE